MKFHFPKKDYVLVHVKFKPSMFESIKAIAEQEECLRSDTILVLLEAAIDEYKYQMQKEKKLSAAWPIAPSPEKNLDEEKGVERE